MIKLLRCIIGPELYHIYPSTVKTANLYQKNTAEKLDEFVSVLRRFAIEIFRLIWPACLFYAFLKNMFTFEYVMAILDYVPYVTIFIFYCKFVKGVGRLLNTDYQIFIDEFYQTKTNKDPRIRQKFLSKFDFSLSHWSPDYIVSTAPNSIQCNDFIHLSFLDRLLHYPFLFLGYICVNLFGRRLMFPGSLQILQYFSSRLLFDGRIRLIVHHQARRALIRTYDRHNLDTMFVDRRTLTENGRFLVITCEGNVGFYETGCMLTPLSRGYSVLGWNRPGFAQSSGYPTVQSEVNAIDAVLKYAIDQLGFSVDRIVLYAWSIGGYAACWAGAHYPQLAGLVLDAIFDDVLPIAQRQLPISLSRFVEKTIRSYLNLNNIPLIRLYQGAFYLIRRTEDKILNEKPGDLSTNCANEILYAILPYRYPLIYSDEQSLADLRNLLSMSSMERRLLYKINRDEMQIPGESFSRVDDDQRYPCRFGENFSLFDRQTWSLYLIDEYLIDFHGEHGKSLPASYFHLPRRSI